MYTYIFYNFFFSIFYAHTDKNDPYLYEINLCQTGNILVAIRQTNKTSKQSYVVGRFKGARVFGGSK